MAVECPNVLKLGDITVCSGKNPQSGLQNLLFFVALSPSQTTSSALVQPQLIGVSDMFLLSLKNTRNHILLYHIHMCRAIQMYVYVYMYVNIYIYIYI